MKVGMEGGRRLLAAISLAIAYAWGLAKVTIGLLGGQFVYCLSGIVILLLGAGRHFYLRHIKGKGKPGSILGGTFIVLAGAGYAIGAIRLFFVNEGHRQYPTILSITLAFLAFLELGISLYNLCQRSRGDLDSLAYRCLCLFASLLAIGTAQNALLSAQGKPTEFADGLFGTIVGFLMALLGIFVLIKAGRDSKPCQGSTPIGQESELEGERKD